MSAAVANASELDDVGFMDLALSLGRRGLGRTWPNPSVGAVVVRPDVGTPIIVGRGWTAPGGRPHAETQALARAGSAARGATLYVTLEPCSHHGQTAPCVDAIISAGIAEVVSAIEDPNPQVLGKGHRRMAASGIRVRVGIGAEQALLDHAGHIQRVRQGRPHVMLKLAVSADGKAGLAGRRPVAITGETATRHVHLMRATSDAVLTGIGTVEADDPLLTCRLPGMAGRSPIRVVLDSKLRLNVGTQLAKTAREFAVWILTGEAADAAREAVLRAQGVEVTRSCQADGQLDLRGALAILARRGITRVMVEAGPILAAALLRADLIDQAVLFRSAESIGPTGIDALEGLSLDALTGSPRLRLVGKERIGSDTMETFERP